MNPLNLARSQGRGGVWRGQRNVVQLDTRVTDFRTYSARRVRFREGRGSVSRPYSTILRYSVPRLISSTLAACFLFQFTLSRTRTMCARSASARVGSRSLEASTGV